MRSHLLQDREQTSLYATVKLWLPQAQFHSPVTQPTSCVSILGAPVLSLRQSGLSDGADPLATALVVTSLLSLTQEGTREIGASSLANLRVG